MFRYSATCSRVNDVSAISLVLHGSRRLEKIKKPRWGGSLVSPTGKFFGSSHQPALGIRNCHAAVFLSNESEKLLILRVSLEGKTDKTFAAHAKATIFTGKQQIV